MRPPRDDYWAGNDCCEQRVRLLAWAKDAYQHILILESQIKARQRNPGQINEEDLMIGYPKIASPIITNTAAKIIPPRN